MRSINTETKNKLKYIKQNIHEDNLKAFMYMQCKLENIRIILEYRITNPINGVKCRADAIILNENKEIVAVVEVKKPYKDPNRVRKINPRNRQWTRYKNLNMPVFVVYHKDHISRLINYLKTNLL